jgi:UDP-GlcNAc:undecaprenyl-phosphate GlcNAc-1-phosphate transferase
LFSRRDLFILNHSEAATTQQGNVELTALLCFLIAFGVSYFGTILLLRIPTARGFVDVPNERSSHEAPKLRVGGVAIVVSFYIAITYLFVTVPDTRGYMPLAVGSGMLFLTGVIDDWRGLGVKIRFLMQFVAAITMVSFGVTLDHVYIPAVGAVDLGWTSVPLTIVLFVVSINFYNFIDGIDGLAAGSAWIASGFLALIAMMLGHNALALIFVALAGSAVGFLQFNFPPSRLFMGDSGSTFLGFFFAFMAVSGNRLQPELPVFIPALILSSLYLDAGLTLFNRILKRENIFRAHHTHYYQRLLSLGLNHKQVTLLEYAVMILLGTGAVVYFRAGSYFPVFLSVCWFVLFTLAVLKIRGLERGDKKLFWEKRTMFAIGLDLLLIAVSYLGAYFLRMNFRFTDPEGTAVLRALPIVLVVRSFMFYRYGLYLSVYKYTSTADIIRILKAVTMGSVVILTLVVLLYRFVSFPRTLFIIEYFLLTLLVLGARFSFRLFHEIGKEAHGADVRRVGIIGAGDRGERLARELRNNNDPTSIECFVDDDPDKIGMTMLGKPITGPLARLEEIAAEYTLDAAVLAVSRLPGEKTNRLVRAAGMAGISLEGKRDLQWPQPGRTDAAFERLARGLGREAFEGVELASRVFYRGKRVLLTGGGGPVGEALARRLVALGASVFVQIAASGESRAFGAALRREIFLYMGAPRDKKEWRRMMDAVTPDVVFHCLAPGVDADANVEPFLWDNIVVSTSDLAKAVEHSTVSSVVLLSFWQDEITGAAAARMSAVAETMLLNDPAVRGTSPKSLRFPRVFTAADLDSSARGRPAAEPGRGAVFALLEPEAVSLALDCAASQPGSAVLVCRYDREFTTVETVSILSGDGQEDPLSGAGRTGGAGNAGPMYPAEVVSGSSPLSRTPVIKTPVVPAENDLAKVLTDDFLRAGPETRSGWLDVTTRCLYYLPASRTASGATHDS